jgi:hypothetical protein
VADDYDQPLGMQGGIPIRAQPSFICAFRFCNILHLLRVPMTLGEAERVLPPAPFTSLLPPPLPNLGQARQALVGNAFTDDDGLYRGGGVTELQQHVGRQQRLAHVHIERVREAEVDGEAPQNLPLLLSLLFPP